MVLSQARKSATTVFTRASPLRLSVATWIQSAPPSHPVFKINFNIIFGSVSHCLNVNHLFRGCVLCVFVRFIERTLRENNWVHISKIMPYRISTKFWMHLDLPDTGASLDGCQKWITRSLHDSVAEASRLRTACIAGFGLTPGTGSDCLRPKRRNRHRARRAFLLRVPWSA